ncbi:MAG: oligosaccharide flippase family protein [Nitrosospira sp.]|nr:oligosaccharide flippase family protein [Nitrosospira sp.]
MCVGTKYGHARLMLADLLERIKARLPKSRIVRSVAMLAGGTAMGQIIMICAMPIVTRLYSPAQIGVISLFLAFFGFWVVTLSLRYEYALLIARDDAESHVVHRIAVTIVVVMSMLGLPVLWALQRTNSLGFGLLPDWAPFVAVPIFLGYGFFMVYRSWALRAGMVGAITKASIARSGANAGTQVALGAVGLGVTGLFAAQLAASWAPMLKLARGVSKHFAASKPASMGGGDLLRAARKFAKFPFLETPSAWIDQLGLTLPLPMVATLHGATAAGWFGLARMVASVPNSQIGRAIADVFQMEFAKAVLAGDKVFARGLFYKFLRKLALIGLLPLAGMMALGPWAVPWVFGNTWSEAGFAIAAIAPWMYAALVIGSLSRALSVLQAQEYKFIYDTCAVLLLVAAFLASRMWNYSFFDTILAISFAGFLGYVIYGVLLVGVVELRLKGQRQP